jgi:hypothetical protein
MGLGPRVPSVGLPIQLTISDCALRLDGGTMHLIGADEAGREICITRAAPLDGASTLVAGRLYFDGALVPIRSEQEARILKLLSERQFDVSIRGRLAMCRRWRSSARISRGYLRTRLRKQ